MIGITKQDLADWMQNPVTKAFQEGIKAKIRQIEKAVGAGELLDSGNPFATHSNVSRLVGRIEGLQDALEVDDTTVLGEDE